MRLDLGYTFVEKVRYLSQWHPFFTLLPRNVESRDWRFFERIERKGTYYGDPLLGGMWKWEYRAMQKKEAA